MTVFMMAVAHCDTINSVSFLPVARQAKTGTAPSTPRAGRAASLQAPKSGLFTAPSAGLPNVGWGAEGVSASEEGEWIGGDGIWDS